MKDFSYAHEKKEVPQVSAEGGSSLPSRKITHPKPKSFFEKPLFSFILFLLFLFLLLFLYYYFYQKGEALSFPFFQPSSNSLEKGETTQSDTAGKGEGGQVEKASLDQANKNGITDSREDGALSTQPAEDRDGLKTEKEIEKPVVSDPGNRDRSTAAPAKEERKNSAKKGPQSLRYFVKDDDTLFRIAMKFYGSQAGIDRIRKANKIQGDLIYAGETLIIPSPVNR